MDENLNTLFTLYGFLIYLKELHLQNTVNGLTVQMLDELLHSVKKQIDVGIKRSLMGT
jgi:hypothetical protein